VLIWTHADDRWVVQPNPAWWPPARITAAVVRDVLGLPDLRLDVLATRPVDRTRRSPRPGHAQGPVFLVGDAAHRFPPAGATGVSTAMHDVHNLAWKIAAVGPRPRR